jgi:hypothetical protein
MDRALLFGEVSDLFTASGRPDARRTATVSPWPAAPLNRPIQFGIGLR